MDTENSFDSDTSESWSLIDMNCDRPSEINLADEIGTEVFETKPEEEIIEENCSPLPGEQGGDGLHDVVIPENDVKVSSADNNLKNQQDFHSLYQIQIGDECDIGNTPEVNCSGLNVYEGENIGPVTKDFDEDTDGISVISESEFNDFKLTDFKFTAYDDDDPFFENLPEYEGHRFRLSDLLIKKAKELNMGPGGKPIRKEDSDMDPDKAYYAPSFNVFERTHPVERKEEPQRAVRVYRHNRNNVANFVLTVTMGIIFAGIGFIAVGHFLGVQDSQEAAGHMALTVKKLQMENVLLQSRVTQLSRAVLARGVNKLDLKEETKPPCLKNDNDCRKSNVKFYERDTDEDNYDPSYNRHKDSLDFSIPLSHPKNVLALKQILNGNEVLFARESTEPVEPFNFSKYVEAIVKAQFAAGSTPEPEDIIGKIFKPTELEKKGKLKTDDEERDQKDERPEDNCQTDGSTSKNDETQKGNCLAIRENDLSQFRWYILMDKPKCSGIKVEDLKGECLFKIPMDRKYHRKNTNEPDDSRVITAKTSSLKEKDNELELVPRGKSLDYAILPKSNHDNDVPKEASPMKKDLQLKKTKKRDMYLNFATRYFYYRGNSLKKKGKDEKEKGQTVTADQYLKYFANVSDEARKNKWRTKECVKGENGRCELKFKDKNENKHVQNKNHKKNMGKRSKPDGNRSKKEKFPIMNKDKTDLRPKKWKTCSIKPTLKCGNDSKCEDCACKSGEWFSKWAEGRERCRRDQKISEWQFERAKSREHSRIGDAFWQFSRAYGRENRRMNPYSRKKKAKNFPRKGYTFNSHSRI